MRWVGDQLQPVKGWSQVSYDPTESPIRKVHVWVDNEGQRYTAYLCEQHCYVDVGDGVLLDVTPAGGMTSPTPVGPGGYGDNLYSLDNYGDARPVQSRPRPLAPCYSIGNWGEDLLVMTSADARLLRWQPSVGGQLLQVPSSPLGRCFVVTPERFVIIFGKDGLANKFGWCDQEDIEDWAVAVTSKVGNYTVQPAAPIVCAVVSGGGEVVFWTTTHVYVIRYISLPYIYGYSELGIGSTPVSPASVSSISDGVIWISESGYWRYNGTSIAPVDCPIWSWVTDHWDPLYARYESFLVDITFPTELWWFFPVENDLTHLNQRYAIFNYRDNWFSMGRLSRSAGYSASYIDLPIMAMYDKVYRHEYGNAYPTTDELPWIESYTLNAGSGNYMTYIDQMLPDIEGNPAALDFIFYMSNNRIIPMDDVSLEKRSPTKKVNGQGYVNVRETSRDFRLRIQSSQDIVSPWTLGQTLISAVPRGNQ